MTRRTLFSSLAGAAAASLAYPCYVEPRWLDVVHHPVPLKHSSAHPSIRLLHLADLHASWSVPLSLIDSAITAGLHETPDVICLTGDFISYRDDFDSRAYARVLSRLSQAAPTFAVVGNHDGGPWAKDNKGNPDHKLVDRILEASGIELLHNRSHRLAVGNRELELVGVGDIWNGELHAKPAFADVDTRLPTVLLSHNPDTKTALQHQPWHLMLSGHTHGGQVLLPFCGPVFAPVEDKRYVAGLKPWRDRLIHVTRGVGSWGGIRFRCRPEVSLLSLG